MTWTVKIDKGDKANIERMLHGIKNGAPRVISRAMNKTIVGVRTDAVKEIGSEITAKKTVIRKTFKLNRAGIRNLSASSASIGKPLPLGYFSVRQVKKGVSIQIFRNKARQIIGGAFLWVSRAGHKVVLSRVWKAARKPIDPRIAYGALPRRYRYPIKELFGPRVPDIFSNEPVLNPVLKKADDRFQKNLANQLDWELSKV